MIELISRRDMKLFFPLSARLPVNEKRLLIMWGRLKKRFLKNFDFGGKRGHVMERDCESFIYLPKMSDIERK